MTDGPDILELLIEHELALKRLYEALASAFAGRKDFWRSLAEEEQKHADQLGGLRSDAGVGAWLLSDSGINPQSIKSSIAYVDSQVARAKGGGLDLTHALSGEFNLTLLPTQDPFSVFFVRTIHGIGRHDLDSMRRYRGEFHALTPDERALIVIEPVGVVAE